MYNQIVSAVRRIYINFRDGKIFLGKKSGVKNQKINSAIVSNVIYVRGNYTDAFATFFFGLRIGHTKQE